MINWNKTTEQFGITLETATTRKIVVVCCDKCGIEKLLKFGYHELKIRRMGRYWCHKCAVSDEQAKLRSKELSTRLWQQPDYREQVIYSIKHGKAIEEKAKRTKSEISSASMSSNEVRQRLSDISKRYWQDDNYKEKHNINYRRAMADPITRKNYLNIILSDKFRDKMKRLWDDESYRQTQAKARAA